VRKTDIQVWRKVQKRPGPFATIAPGSSLHHE
jgi:hypothetical protein